MRLNIRFSFEGKLTLPIQYNNIVQGLIYNNISDKAFKGFLHDRGYKYEKRNFKLFTFSRILGEFKMNKKNYTIIFESPIQLTISSVIDDFINDFGSTIMQNNNLILGRTPIKLDQMEFHRSNQSSDNVKISMLSPMVTYSTVVIHDKKRTIYHKPGDSLFSKLAYENLQKKYESLYNKEIIDNNFFIAPVGEDKIKRVSVNYKGFNIKGWTGEYFLTGSPELIELAYDTGLGSKNAQGFGCFEII